MKIAIIDIGTNTFNLLIMEEAKVLLSEKLSVQLGEGGITQNKITPQAFERGMKAFARYRETALKHQVDEMYAFATSAVRGAKNRDSFIEEAYQKHGIKINLLDGQREAELIYEGVKNAVDMEGKTHLIMDIGGGSTEFIFGNGEEPTWAKSYDIGSSRLSETFTPADPVSEEDVARINDYLEDALSELKEKQQEYQAVALIGSSGSFETFAQMIRENFPGKKKCDIGNGFDFNLHNYSKIAEKMLTSDLHERLATPGMIPMRANMIPMAALLIDFVLKNLDISSMKLSTYAVKEGVYYSITETEQQWQKSSL